MKRYILIFALLVVPKFALADIFINEIMYDLDGTDSGREWIEVYNNSSGSIDLSTYFLYETNVAHKITFVSGNQQINTGEYAIITSNQDKFIIDYPDFSGNLFDSVFSLNNSGEELVLLDSDKNEISLVNYTSDLGANGTGNSLQLNDDVFIPAEPTPGELNRLKPDDEIIEENLIQSDSGGNKDISTHSGQNKLTDFRPKEKVKTGIGRARNVSVNSPVNFEVSISGEEKGKHFWSFGDGKKGKGEKVKHYFEFPGEYNVVLNSYFDDYRTISRTNVYVSEPDLSIKLENELVKVTNNASGEINIGNFKVISGELDFKFPEDTILSPKQGLMIRLNTSNSVVSLYYPNNEILISNISNNTDINEIKKICNMLETKGILCDVEKLYLESDRI